MNKTIQDLVNENAKMMNVFLTRKVVNLPEYKIMMVNNKMLKEIMDSKSK